MAERYVSPIDPHVHLRGIEYTTNFLRLGFRDAQAVGLAALIEQPNPQPWLTSAEIIQQRLESSKTFRGPVIHRAHIGITNDYAQAARALTAVTLGDAEFVSDKIFYVHSTGNMGVLDPDYQKRLWKLKADMGYRGVSIGHFDAEDAFIGEFDPKRPITHSLRQHAGAELVQVERQIQNAYDAGFKGTFYIAHVSNPDTVKHVNTLKKTINLPFEIAMEMTFHHALLNWEDYAEQGNHVKMNPPLRSPERQQQLYEQLLRGDVDIIGTDHAPHPLERKDSDNPPSGIPALPAWPLAIHKFRKDGMSEDTLKRLTFDTANRLFFRGELEPKIVDAEYYPELWNSYRYNPFMRIERDLNRA